MEQEDLENYVGYMIRVTGPMFHEPVMVKLLEVEEERIFVVQDTSDKPFWLQLSEVKIG